MVKVPRVVLATVWTPRLVELAGIEPATPCLQSTISGVRAKGRNPAIAPLAGISVTAMTGE